jgi:hypothetical protein
MVVFLHCYTILKLDVLWERKAQTKETKKYRKRERQRSKGRMKEKTKKKK